MNHNYTTAIEAYIKVLPAIVDARFPGDPSELRHLKVCMARYALEHIPVLIFNGGAAGVQATRMALEFTGLLKVKSSGTALLDEVNSGNVASS